jgi:NAD-dependent deacetylase
MSSQQLSSDDFTEVIDIIRGSKSVAVLTGAGISAESGLATFRGKDGIWSKMRPEELASVDGFMANPKLVWEWYQHRRDILNGAHPAAGHWPWRVGRLAPLISR